MLLIRRMLLHILFASLLIPCFPASAGTLHERRLTVHDLKRHYLVHLPAAYTDKRAWPVVIMFHGGGGTGRAAMRDTGWAEKAEKEGFIAVFPDGTTPDPTLNASFRNNPQTWNDGSSRGIGAAVRKVDDLTFVRRMLDDLATRYAIDKRRIFATGFSNGASMTFRLGREMPHAFAALAPVAGTDWLTTLKPVAEVPLLYITGTADPLCPFNGGEIHFGLRRYGVKPPTPAMIRHLAQQQSCVLDAHTLRDEGDVKGIRYAPCRGRGEVQFYVVEGLGHHWPGGKSLLPKNWVGPASDKLNATELIWTFFSKHAL